MGEEWRGPKVGTIRVHEFNGGENFKVMYPYPLLESGFGGVSGMLVATWCSSTRQTSGYVGGYLVMKGA